MNTQELVIRFQDGDSYQVAYNGQTVGPFEFYNPCTANDRRCISWYLEVYATQSLASPDDEEAARIEGRMAALGEALFAAVFDEREAQRLFDRFHDNNQNGARTLTLESTDTEILALPWELLYLPNRAYICREQPRISLRRALPGIDCGYKGHNAEPRQTLRLLMVVSRPEGVGFLDPRADPQAVLDAIDAEAPGRVEVEFLRPATRDALVARLGDERLPPINILHFDGHGTFQQIDEKTVEGDPKFGRNVLSEIQRQRSRKDSHDDIPVGVGLLVFENDAGGKAFLSASDLAEDLLGAKIDLVVLSACQSATLEHKSDDDDERDPQQLAKASVAGSLIAAGLPAVIAMSHSVLVPTTRALFGAFYASLGRGHGIGHALDDARVHIANNPAKYKVNRDGERRDLKLHDWFVPCLYQHNTDTKLLDDKKTQHKPPVLDIPTRDGTGFYGRRRELWAIERAFSATGQRACRRFSICGFGGQGKTALAREAGRWLQRNGLFARVVFVSYAQHQGSDPVEQAIASIGAALGQSLTDAAAVTAALEHTPTLLILDNLESLPTDTRAALLDAAVAWSEAGDSRLLLTSRQPDLNHAHYPIGGSYRHRRLALDGLGSYAQPDDAIDYYWALAALPGEAAKISPPNRAQLIELLDKLRFHPLSIAVLAQQLKSRDATDLLAGLEQLLDDPVLLDTSGKDTPLGLAASLELSLQQLPPELREAVSALGVFEGGAFEDELLAITGLGSSEGTSVESTEQLHALLSALDSGDPRSILAAMAAAAGQSLPDDAELPEELLTQLLDEAQIAKLRQGLQAKLAKAEQSKRKPSDNIWPALRQQLQTAALVELESIPGIGVPFIRFHPTLAPLLWARLADNQRATLHDAHRERYYALSGYLYNADNKNPEQARAIARRELPNLLAAVERALDGKHPDAVDFVDNINRFLNIFSQPHSAALLSERACALGGEVGSQGWYLALSGSAEQLFGAGQLSEAEANYNTLLVGLGQQPSYERTGTLLRLARCHEANRQSRAAIDTLRSALKEIKDLPASDDVTRLHGTLHSDIADNYVDTAEYDDARRHYQSSLDLKATIDDPRGEASVNGQLGTLEMLVGNLSEAAERHQQALTTFTQLGEPAAIATAHHQLAMVYQEAKQWPAAEHHYRESAELKIAHGDLGGAANSWMHLAIVFKSQGDARNAETWYRKALTAFEQAEIWPHVATTAINLAELLSHQPERLNEAQELAERALEIDRQLDPAAVEIWKNYNILANIAEAKGDTNTAQDYRRQAREARAGHSSEAVLVKRFAALIVAIASAAQGNAHAIEAAQGWLKGATDSDFQHLATAVALLLEGERDANVLFNDKFDDTDHLILQATLKAIDEPDYLEALMGDAADEQ